MIEELQRQARSLANPQRAATNRWFFKTGKGQYGYGDKFLGLTVPQCRLLARTYRDLPLTEVRKLLRSAFHEDRLISLLILIHQYHEGDAKTKTIIYKTYLQSTQWINNWDLVDASAYKIIGQYLLHRSPTPLLTLARSKNLWERRIAIVATMAFISQERYNTTLQIATIVLQDPHDLIHKAVGWMLREVGKRDPKTLRGFLDRHVKTMPRTMLRYAIEKFPPKERRQWLSR